MRGGRECPRITILPKYTRTRNDSVRYLGVSERSELFSMLHTSSPQGPGTEIYTVSKRSGRKNAEVVKVGLQVGSIRPVRRL